jgi:hypothetical protein
MMLTERDREILSTLLEKARVMSLGHIADRWWQGDTGLAARRLSKLSDGGWIVGEHLLARPLLSLQSPLFTWAPTAPDPDSGRLSWRARSRWKSPAIPTPVWHVTPLAAARLGGHARQSVKNKCQLTHDLHVASIYLNLLREDEKAAAMWVGEDSLPEGLVAGFVPDAVLMRRGQIIRAIEFGGAYPRSRFESLHDECKFLKLPYIIW